MIQTSTNTSLEPKRYIDLNKIYPIDKTIETETYKISSTRLTEDQVKWEKVRNFRSYWMVMGLQADFDYIRLIKKGEGVMMSDTPMERNTSENFVKKANGDVVIFGLGLGLIILPLLNSDDVKSILVVEIDKSLIEIVSPYLKKYDVHNKLTIVEGDAFSFPIEKGRKFDSIYFDIWIDINSDNYEEQKKLTKKYMKYQNRENKDSFIDHWMKSHYVQEKAKERREKSSWGGYW